MFKGSLDRIKAAVGVDIQRHAGVGMSHQILQTFNIKPSLLNVGAEGMPQHMRRDPRDRLAVCLFKSRLQTSHIVLQVHRNLRHPGFVQKEEAAVTVYQQFTFGAVLAFTTRISAM